jgi:hypothetical protein
LVNAYNPLRTSLIPFIGNVSCACAKNTTQNSRREDKIRFIRD